MSHEGETEDFIALQLRQGDVLALPTNRGDGAAIPPSPDEGSLVAILSQTCDVVQPSKTHCIVAPIIEASPAEISGARRGKRPLLLYLVAPNGGGPWVADIERAFSVPKATLLNAQLRAHCVESASSQEARHLGSRIGRAFSRFPFPDEVFPVFAKLQAKLRDAAGSRGNLGHVIDLVREIRVSADQWDKPGRRLKLYVIVSRDLLIPFEDADPAWGWSRVKGWRASDVADGLQMDRICELILSNTQDLTSLMYLWEEFGTSLYSSFLEPALNAEVSRVEVVVVSDLEFTHRDLAGTESLDLETLSDPATQ